MDTESYACRWTMLAVLATGFLASIGTTAGAAGHGPAGGRGARPPRVSAPKAPHQAPRLPHISAPARRTAPWSPQPQRHPSVPAGNPQAKATRSGAHARHSSTRASHATAGTPSSQTHSRNIDGSRTSANTVRNGGGNRGFPANLAAVGVRPGLSASPSAYRYTHGHGTSARTYRAYGYGRGYRNRYYGAGYGYGRSQGYSRGIISRLRSVHASLARLDHDYQGHRVRALHAISMAIRQLSHRSMAFDGVGFAPGLNNRIGGGQGMAMGRGARRSVLGGAGPGRQPMTQAQSDARMNQALRTLQGIGMQLSGQGDHTMGHARALGHIRQAIRELNLALSIR